MVVADQGNYLADVVFVIEGTANLSPYVESLKKSYIIPTLEHFNGGPAVDRDCGCDFNSTMYALVVFMAADCAPEIATNCSAPTTSIHKFLSWLDKVLFIGGAGESHSHIAEGLSTALQVFDDFQVLRENNIPTQKHCILVCNSPPYPLPSLESAVYSGLTPEELASVMAERQINFSILSPRKIPTLFKLFEKAGGDLQHALSKKYAKDLRHLVFLRGYQLPERPTTPVSENKTAVCSPTPQGQKRSNTNSPPNPRESTGFKQHANQSNYVGSDWAASESPTVSLVSQSSAQPSLTGPVAGGQTPVSYAQSGLPGQPNQQINPRPNIPTPPSSHLSSLNQPNPPNVTITSKAQPPQMPGQHPVDSIRPQRGHSPVTVGGPRMPWNQTAVPSPPASTPPTTSVLATQLSMAPSNVSLRHSNPQLTQQGQPVTVPNVAQPSMNPVQGVLNQPGGPMRPNLPGVGLRMTSASPGTIPSVGANNSLAVQLGQHPSFSQQSSQQPTQQSSNMAASLASQGMSSNMQTKLGNTSNLNQITPQVPPMTSSATSNLPPQSMPGNMSTLSIPQSGNVASQSSSQSGAPVAQTKDRRSIWQGVIEFQEKPPTSASQQPQRVTHTLNCQFSSMVTNGELDVNADKWPNRLVLQLFPKHLITLSNLFTVLKTAARHVLIHFSQESEALQKLCKTMSSGWVGCIQFPGQCDIRIMVVLYMPDKRIYMGFIANDQESFFNTIRQMYENHRKQQQVQKQRLQQQLSGNQIPTSEGIGLPSSTSSNQGMMMSQPTTANIGGSNNPMGPRIPMGQQPVQQSVPQLPPQVPAQNTSGVHSSAMNQSQQQQQQQQQQQSLAQQQATNARLSQLETARQQNLLKIQQLQQTLEAAQQKELQYKAAQEQQQQQHHQQQQQMIDRQNAIRQLQQQLQQQQQQLQQQQQRIQMQQVSQSSHNPQLRNLLQQQMQQQQMRQQQQQHQILMQQQQQQQHPQNIRGQLSNSGLNASVGQAPQSQQQSQQPQQSWGDSGILDLLPP